MKKLLCAAVLGMLPGLCFGQIYNPGLLPTGVNATVPIGLGTVLYPYYDVANGGNTGASLGIPTGTFASGANSTFTCATAGGCPAFYVGATLAGSDGSSHVLWPAVGGEIGAQITAMSATPAVLGTTITTNIPTNAATVGGTFSVAAGTSRWNATSSVIGNVGAFTRLFTGTATQGNSTWIQQYLANTCDSASNQNVCMAFGGQAANGTMNVMRAARSSDTTSGTLEANTDLLVNDNVAVPTTGWNQYLQTEVLAGAATGKATFGIENSMFNFNTKVQSDPFNINVGTGTVNQRLDCGQSLPSFALTNCTTAMDIDGINGGSYATGILFGSTSLDTSVLTHPPAISMPVGYAINIYKAAGYTTPSWQIYGTNSTTNGNLFVLADNGFSWADAGGTWLQSTRSTVTQQASGSAASAILRRIDAGAGAVAQYIGQGLNTTPANALYGQVNINADNTTAGAEIGSISLQTASGGAETTRVNVTNIRTNLANHLGSTSAAIPVLAGTGCAATTNIVNTDVRGSITATAATSCTETFNVAYPSTALPVCTATSSSTTVPVAVSATATVLTLTSAALTGTINWHCMQ